jgi:predicted nucleotidyltransferase
MSSDVKTNRININSIKKKLVPFFKSQADVRLAFLFGSVAEKRTHSLSDIDIALLKPAPPVDQ